MNYKLLQIIPEMARHCARDIECEEVELVDILLSYTKDLPSVTFIHRYKEDGGDRRQDIQFHVVEVNGEAYTVRWFHTKIYRQGGVAKSGSTIEDIAKKIGWTRDPQELLSQGWDGEDEKWESI